MTRDEIKERVKFAVYDLVRRLYEDVTERGVKIRCANPDHPDNDPSMDIYVSSRGEERVRCRSCGFDGDGIDLVKGVYAKYHSKNLTFNEALEVGASLLGLEMPRKGSRDSREVKVSPLKPISGSRPSTSGSTTDFEMVNKFRSTLKEIDPKGVGASYLSSRGISVEVAQAMGVLERVDFKHPKYDKGRATYPTLCFPLLDHNKTLKGFIARFSTDKKPTDKSKKEAKVKKVEGQGGFFGTPLLVDSDVVFVTEGEMDTLAYGELGFNACSMGDIGKVDSFVTLLKTLKGERFDVPRLVLSIDKDERGQEAQAKLQEALEDLGVLYVVSTLPQGCKDANEALMNDKKGFQVMAQNDKEKALEMVDELAKDVRIESTLDTINKSLFNSKPIKPLSTGFSNLDEMLRGGFREGLTILMGESGTGKTTLALQIADNVASNDNDVLIFSLEMPKKDLICKSLSRVSYERAFEKYGFGKTKERKDDSLFATYFSEEYVRGQESDYKDILAKEAIEKYISTYGDRVKICSGLGDVTVDDIKDKLKEYKVKFKHYPSLVVIDYVQIIQGLQGQTDKQAVDYSVKTLLKLGKALHIPILCISSVNRSSYSSGLTLASSKESGSIEFSAEVVLALENYVPQGAFTQNSEEDKKGGKKNQGTTTPTQKKIQPIPNAYEQYEQGSYCGQFNGVTDKQVDIYARLIQCRNLKNRTNSRGRVFFDYKTPFHTMHPLATNLVMGDQTHTAFDSLYVGFGSQEILLHRAHYERED